MMEITDERERKKNKKQKGKKGVTLAIVKL